MCEALGLARSNIHVLKGRPSSWIDRRTAHASGGDGKLLAEIHTQIAKLPSYGYRCACALRVMAGNGLLLAKVPQRARSSGRTTASLPYR